MVIHAAQKWARGKKNVHGYQRATLAVPEKQQEQAAAHERQQREPLDVRAGRTGPAATPEGGRRTVHSLASRSGIDTVPVVTCRPWVTR